VQATMAIVATKTRKHETALLFLVRPFVLSWLIIV
jgi:hypothetical protein